MEINPALPQVACFDTAFHRSAPEVAEAFALPRELFDEGVRRYGFHGFSYEIASKDAKPRRDRDRRSEYSSVSRPKPKIAARAGIG